jgi:hypothetical protein
MRVETHKNLFFQGYTDQAEFQREVIRIILSDDKYLVFYIGRVEDLDFKYRYYLFGRRVKNGRKTKLTTSEVKEKWTGLLMLTGNPTWCIVLWNKVKCKYIPRTNKLKKDGTPRKTPWKKKNSVKKEY